MIYALDSNILSYMVKKDKGVQASFKNAVDGNHLYAIPPLVYYEVKRWLILKGADIQLKEFTELYKNSIKAEMNIDVWEKSIELYTGLRSTGKSTDDADIFIAAYCIVNGYVLVTNNVKHFEAIDELDIINWKN